MFDLNLKNKIAVVTGSSRGIGKAIAFALADSGAVVYMNGKNEDHIKKAVEEAKELGFRVDFLTGDVSDEAFAKIFTRSVFNKSGQIDILVNNAGISEWRLLEDVDMKSWQNVLNNNLNSAFMMSREAVQYMKSGGGKIINIASTVGIRGRRGGVHYVASKGGLISITKAMALELAPLNINVNAIAPGLVDTELAHKICPSSVFRKVKEETPLGRIGSPNDIAQAVLFFSSTLSDFITGQVLVIDGGLTIF